MAISRQVRLFWDVETQANEEAVSYLDLPKAPRNVKDPEKAEAAIAEKFQELVDNAGLDPFLCELRSIGWAIGQGGEVHVDIVNKKCSEADVLEQFWENFSRCSGYNVGWNQMDFDFSVVLARSMVLGIKPTMMPTLARYRTDPTLDLMWVTAGWQWQKVKKMKWMAKRLGIEIPAGEEVDGSQVSTMTDKQLRAYNASDIVVLQGLYKRFNGVYFMH